MRGGIAVVREGGVQPVQAQALQAVFDAAAHAGGAVVPVLAKAQSADTAALLARRRRVRRQQPADLARQHERARG